MITVLPTVRPTVFGAVPQVWYKRKAVDDGELLVSGPLGYRDGPERTAEPIDKDGWLHTGDIAEIGTPSSNPVTPSSSPARSATPNDSAN